MTHPNCGFWYEMRPLPAVQCPAGDTQRKASPVSQLTLQLLVLLFSERLYGGGSVGPLGRFGVADVVGHGVDERSPQRVSFNVMRLSSAGEATRRVTGVIGCGEPVARCVRDGRTEALTLRHGTNTAGARLARLTQGRKVGGARGGQLLGGRGAG